jgi:hypothetical protein
MVETTSEEWQIGTTTLILRELLGEETGSVIIRASLRWRVLRSGCREPKRDMFI